MPAQSKYDMLEKVNASLEASQGFYVIDYRGLTVKETQELRRAIREHHSDATTVVIAQRVSSIMALDDIIVLDEGRVIGHGTHAQLMESCPTYREIYKTQMGEVA